ncbi:copper transporter [Saccharopolyspora flava]|uniref:Copper transport outer membrane protein, MctB n=1 Tax=Saccharopolyspora flava TaxID=95161 RepID=A0A1I6U232_9PSEU|nr:copper transporter [Saccharopolyspora flava]SFS95500.1 Copper transport outer membrane protein, MctB [Saccharopolyspora flava]
MITMRYHIVSIAAVFLALAVGVVLGTSSVSEGLLKSVGGEKQQLQDQVDQLSAESARYKAQADAADRFDTTVAPLAVQGQLTGRSVVLISSPEVDDARREGMAKLLRDSGADVTGEVRLGEALTDPERTDQLRGVVTQLLPAGVQLPTAADPGTLAGGLIGPLTLVNPETGQPQAADDARAAALSGLAGGGYATASEGLRPAQLAVVLTGGRLDGDNAADEATALARFATQIDRSGQGAVLAGAHGSADGRGAVGVARADPAMASALSTVDNAETGAGRVAVVLAAREQADRQSGHYGVASSAQGPVPGTRGDS